MVTSTLVLDGAGGVCEYVGGYDDWLRQSQAEEEARAMNAPRGVLAPGQPRPILERATASPSAPRKLSFNEQRALEAQRVELAGLPALIEALEAEQGELTQSMSDPAFYQQDSEQITGAARRIHELEETLAAAYRRWEELSGLLE